jgi:hypothetical protein
MNKILPKLYNPVIGFLIEILMVLLIIMGAFIIAILVWYIR